MAALRGRSIIAVKSLRKAERGPKTHDLLPDRAGAVRGRSSSRRAASRRSPSLTMLYRSKTLRVLWPLNFIATRSGTPARTMLRIAVRRKSCGMLAGHPALPPINAEYLHERLPHSELHLIDATHFVWEDAADEYAALLNAWWAGGFKTCMNTSKASATG